MNAIAFPSLSRWGESEDSIDLSTKQDNLIECEILFENEDNG
jgi:hypothetical protein